MTRLSPLATACDRDGRFVNWAGTVVTRPARWHRPATEDAVRSVVVAAASAGRRVRVVGAGHSWSDIAAPYGDAVSLENLASPVAVHADRRHVTVPGGMRLRDLTSALRRDGLALPVVGSIQAQTVAGATATGTHGSSLVHGNLATLVTAMRLVDGTGEVVTLDGDDERLAGGRVHLGALGVVTQLTLRVQPARRLRQTVTHVPVASVPEQLQEIAASAEYVKVWWLPQAADAQVVRYDATTDPPTRLPSAATLRWVDDHVMHRWLFRGMVRAQHRWPQLTAAANRRLAPVYLGPAEQVGDDMVMLNTPMPARHRETEAAVPLAAAGVALSRLLEVFGDGRPAANYPVEIRFVRADDAWLSPAYGVDTCQIGAYTSDGPVCATYFAAFWDVMRDVGARPHWGKEHDHDAAGIAAVYPQLDRFRALRDALDPRRVFGSDALTRLLGD